VQVVKGQMEYLEH